MGGNRKKGIPFFLMAVKLSNGLCALPTPRPRHSPSPQTPKGRSKKKNPAVLGPSLFTGWFGVGGGSGARSRGLFPSLPALPRPVMPAGYHVPLDR